MAAENRLKICLVSSEFAPLAKTGGLADVCSALSAFLHEAGHDVRPLLPLYRRISHSGLKTAPLDSLQNLSMRLGPHSVTYSIDRAQLPDSSLDIYLLRCPALYDRDSIYPAGDDEHYRFILLSRAAIEMCQRTGFAPDIFHAHDWHTALIPLFLKTVYAWDRLFAHTRTVLTIHNLGYQGIYGSGILGDLGLNDGARELHQDDLSAGRINFLKTGLLHADVLTTVSPTYAREIQSDEYGMGLQDLLRARRETVFGILNGVDYGEWDPAHDQLIPHRYSPDNLDGKRKNKLALKTELGLTTEDDAPLIGMVSRLTAQKGIDLIQSVLPEVLRARPLTFAVLGSGEPAFERFFTQLQRAFGGSVCYYNGYSNRLAHWIEAGSDIFLMPSRFEPCGLNQMYSLRYGTVPVVRQTGGLADTVDLYDPGTKAGTGVVFRDYNDAGLRWAVNTALDLFQDKEAWRRIVMNGMAKDFSWARQGAVYVDLFRRLTR